MPEAVVLYLSATERCFWRLAEQMPWINCLYSKLIEERL